MHQSHVSADGIACRRHFHVLRPWGWCCDRDGTLVPVPHGASALEIQGEGQESGGAPRGHGRHELVRIPVRVPGAGVRVPPPGPGVRVQVIEDALDQPGVEEEPLDAVSSPTPSFVGRPPIDEEGFPLDGYHGATGKVEPGTDAFLTTRGLPGTAAHLEGEKADEEEGPLPG